MLKLMKYLRKIDILLFVGMVVLIFCQVALDLMLPDYMSQIVNMLTSGEEIQMQSILIIGGKMLGFSLGSIVCSVLVGLLLNTIGSNLSKNLRSKFFEKVESLSMNEMNRFSPSSLMTRTTNDVTQVKSLITMGMRMLVTAPLMAVWALVKIIRSSGQLSLATMICIVLLVAAIIGIFAFAIPQFKKYQKLIDRTNLVSRENLTGLRVIRAYNSQQFQEERFEEVNESLTKTNFTIGKIMSLLSPVINIILSGLTLFIYWFGASLAQQNLMNIGQIMAFAQYSMMILSSFSLIAMIFVMFPRASVSAKRINEVLDTKCSIQYPQTTNGQFDGEGEIVFKNVSFKYPGAQDYVLKNISFEAKKGQTVAFIGSTGSGKSTLINLVPRFYDATEGQITLDGVDIKDISKKDLIDKIGYVPQKGMLFGGTIASNIRYGKEDATDEQIKKACSIAQCSHFIGKFSDGIEHHIAQGGTNVSGGQRQRLSIARALVKDPEIFIFDDSFSALDYKTDKKLRAAIAKELSGKTNLIVAQRVGTIITADLIIVLENGEVVGKGTHQELLKNCEVYKEIAKSQLGEEVAQ